MPFFFIHLSDPQFGLFESHGLAPGDGTFPETPLYEKAIAAANRLKPAFVVITGDLVQEPDSPEHHAELMRITGQLSDDIPIYFTTGNRDVGDTPTRETLRVYREKFGHEMYSFDAGGSHFVTLNSSICLDPSEVPDEWDSMLDFLRDDLKRHASDATHTVVFMHHPLFSESPDQPDDGNKIIPRAQRMPVLDILREHSVSGVFSGHWHSNAYAKDGDMLMVISGPVGYPPGDDPSGLRIVKVYDDRIEHRYYGMDDVPDTVTL